MMYALQIKKIQSQCEHNCRECQLTPEQCQMHWCNWCARGKNYDDTCRVFGNPGKPACDFQDVGGGPIPGKEEQTW